MLVRGALVTGGGRAQTDISPTHSPQAIPLRARTNPRTLDAQNKLENSRLACTLFIKAGEIECSNLL